MIESDEEVIIFIVKCIINQLTAPVEAHNIDNARSMAENALRKLQAKQTKERTANDRQT